MIEHILTHDEQDIIFVAATVIYQADSMPRNLVEQHGMILDFYLEAFPSQTHALLDLIGNSTPEEWDD